MSADIRSGFSVDGVVGFLVPDDSKNFQLKIKGLKDRTENTIALYK